MDLSRIANQIRSRKYSHLLSLQFSNVPQPPAVQLITQFLTMVKEKIELYQSSEMVYCKEQILKNTQKDFYIWEITILRGEMLVVTVPDAT